MNSLPGVPGFDQHYQWAPLLSAMFLNIGSCCLRNASPLRAYHSPVSEQSAGSLLQMHTLRIWNSVIPQETYLCTSLFQFSLTKSHASKCPGKCLPTVLMISDNFCVRIISPSRLLFINLKKTDLAFKTIVFEVMTKLVLAFGSNVNLFINSR